MGWSTWDDYALDQRKRQLLNAGVFNDQLDNKQQLIEQAKNKKR